MMNPRIENEQSSGQTRAPEDVLFLFGGHFLLRTSTPAVRQSEYEIKKVPPSLISCNTS